MIQSYCPVWFDFDWETVFGHNQPRFKGSEDLSQAVAHLAEERGKKPALVLSDKIDVAFDEQMTPTHWVAIVNVEAFLKSTTKNDRSALFFLSILSAIGEMSRNSGETNLSLRLQQLLKVFQVDLEEEGDWLIEALRQTDSKVILALITASVRALERSANRQDVLKIVQAFEDDSLALIGDIATATRRRRAIELFETNLTAKSKTEPQWQAFLQENVWILGHGTDFLFANVLTKEPVVRAQTVYGNKSRKADYLLNSVGTVSFTRIVEIKLPETPLIGKQYRQGIWTIHDQVIGGLSQTLAYCRNWEGRASTERLPAGVHTVRPQGILIVGELASIQDNSEAIECFEEFRRTQHGVTIICFDELLERAKQMVSA
jgi:hypothetical protein